MGTTFNDKIVIDEAKVLQSLRTQIERLYLADSDFSISTSVAIEIIPNITHQLDKILKSAVKEIIQIPNSTPDSMVYSSRKVKGLGLIKAIWEAAIQSFNANVYLQNSDIEVLGYVINFNSEKLKSTLMCDSSQRTANVGCRNVN